MKAKIFFLNLILLLCLNSFASIKGRIISTESDLYKNKTCVDCLWPKKQLKLKVMHDQRSKDRTFFISVVGVNLKNLAFCCQGHTYRPHHPFYAHKLIESLKLIEDLDIDAEVVFEELGFAEFKLKGVFVKGKRILEKPRFFIQESYSNFSDYSSLLSYLEGYKEDSRFELGSDSNSDY